ncbi:MAG: pyridoxal phosphate-dependent aminotransferase [Bacteroidaceae bacterium]
MMPTPIQSSQPIFSEAQVAQAISALHIADIHQATIGEVLLVATYLEKTFAIPMIRMDQGSPGLPANKVGLEAERAALARGVGSQYPPAGGIPELKTAASAFVKAFLAIDISPRSCVPTTGSVCSSFGSFIACTQRNQTQDTILFLDPGFPIQKAQLNVLGIPYEAFDINPFRGQGLGPKIETYLAKGNIAGIIYSNPNNPTWGCLEESELQQIGTLATKYDVIILEDQAYFCMDTRKSLGTPYQAPFAPTIANYTDNYILMISASKMFSYAGQRCALLCISDKLYERHYPILAARYHDAGIFGDSLIASILYMITSGTTSSTQYGVAEMLKQSVLGTIDFVHDTHAYADRAARMKTIFEKYGFHVVYDKDVSAPVGDGFFFTIGFGTMTSGELVSALLHYGVSSIALSTTGGDLEGVRACTSRMREDLYEVLDTRMAAFAEAYKDRLQKK